MPTIRVADKPTLDTVKSTVDSVKTVVNTVNTKVASLTSGATLKTGSVTVAANGTATIPRTTNLSDAIAVLGSNFVAYSTNNYLANWRVSSDLNLSITEIGDSTITIKSGPSTGGTLYYTYWE